MLSSTASCVTLRRSVDEIQSMTPLVRVPLGRNDEQNRASDDSALHFVLCCTFFARVSVDEIQSMTPLVRVPLGRNDEQNRASDDTVTHT